MTQDLDDAPLETATLDDANPSLENAPTDAQAEPTADGSTEDAPAGDDASALLDGDTSAAPPPPPPAPTPLRVKFLGREGDDPEFALEGAVRHHDGKLEIPGGKSAERALNLMARGREFERVAQPTIQFLQTKVRETETAFNERAARGDALWDFFQGLKDSDPEVQQAWWADFTNSSPLLEAAVDREIARQQYEAARQMRAPNPDEQAAYQQQQTQQAQQIFWSILQSARAQYPHLDDEALADVADGLWEYRQSFLVTADYDDPQRGVVKGQQAWDTQRVARALAREASRRQAASPNGPSAKAAQNAKVVQSASAPARLPQATPPAPSRVSTGQPRAQDGTFTKREEYEREMARKYGL